MQVIIGVGHFDCGAWKTRSCAPRDQRQISVVGEFLITLGDGSGELRDPQINVLAVVELNVPRIAQPSLDPIKLTGKHIGV